MPVPSNISTDSYRSVNITDTRSVREYSREVKDITNPVLVEFYKKDNFFQSIEPFIANAIALDYNSASFIHGVKTSKKYSKFVIFTKNGDDESKKYINAIPLGRDEDQLIKNIIENNAIILDIEDVDTFEDYNIAPPITEYEELIVMLDIQPTKNSIWYVDEVTPVKCYVNFSSGQNDWYVYRYTWNISPYSSEEVNMTPNGQMSRRVTCRVEFRLKDQPDNENYAKIEEVTKNIYLSAVPTPPDMSANVTVKCRAADENFLIDSTYLFTMEISDLYGGYNDWKLSNVVWNIEPTNNLYEATFVPTENIEYEITAKAIYTYKRDASATKEFVGKYTKKAEYPMINADISINIENEPEMMFVGDTIDLRANIANAINTKYWGIKTYEWENAETYSADKSFARLTIEEDSPITVVCNVVYYLKDNPEITKTLSSEKIISTGQLIPVTGDLYIDRYSDKIDINERLELEAKFLHLENDHDWKKVNVEWTGVEHVYGERAVFFKSNIGLYRIDLKYVFEDIYGKGNTIEFNTYTNIQVDYPEGEIGIANILKDKEIPQIGDDIRLTIEYFIQKENESVWDLESVEWENVSEYNGVNAIIQNIQDNTAVNCTLQFKHKTHNVLRNITSSILVSVN